MSSRGFCPQCLLWPVFIFTWVISCIIKRDFMVMDYPLTVKRHPSETLVEKTSLSETFHEVFRVVFFLLYPPKHFSSVYTERETDIILLNLHVFNHLWSTTTYKGENLLTQLYFCNNIRTFLSLPRLSHLLFLGCPTQATSEEFQASVKNSSWRSTASPTSTGAGEGRTTTFTTGKCGKGQHGAFKCWQ